MSQMDSAPPQDVTTEQVLLGTLIMNSEAIPETAEILQPQDFYLDRHRTIFEALTNSSNLDVITLGNELKKAGKLDEIGGRQTLSALVEQAGLRSLVAEYAQKVREVATLRGLYYAGTKIHQLAFPSQYDSIEQVLGEADQALSAVTLRNTQRGFKKADEILNEFCDIFDAAARRKAKLIGLSTGFPELDAMISGLQDGDLIVIGARPSMGKTSLLLNLIEYTAVIRRVPAAIFSLEMSRSRLMSRIIASLGRIDTQRLDTGTITEEEGPRFTEAMERVYGAPFFVDDTPGLTIPEIMARARHLKRQHDIRLLEIDYLQFIRSHRKAQERYEFVSEATRDLKNLAKELGIPVVVASQLSRSVEHRQEKRPQMSDLKESGEIEATADVVMLLYRDEYYNKDKPEAKGLAELIVAKSRNGPPGTVELLYRGYWTRFMNKGGQG